MRAGGPRTQARCAARTHWFRQCRSRCGALAIHQPQPTTSSVPAAPPPAPTDDVLGTRCSTTSIDRLCGRMSRAATSPDRRRPRYTLVHHQHGPTTWSYESRNHQPTPPMWSYRSRNHQPTPPMWSYASLNQQRGWPPLATPSWPPAPSSVRSLPQPRPTTGARLQSRQATQALRPDRLRLLLRDTAASPSSAISSYALPDRRPSPLPTTRQPQPPGSLDAAGGEGTSPAASALGSPPEPPEPPPVPPLPAAPSPASGSPLSWSPPTQCPVPSQFDPAAQSAIDVQLVLHWVVPSQLYGAQDVAVPATQSPAALQVLAVCWPLPHAEPHDTAEPG